MPNENSVLMGERAARRSRYGEIDTIVFKECYVVYAKARASSSNPACEFVPRYMHLLSLSYMYVVESRVGSLPTVPNTSAIHVR